MTTPSKSNDVSTPLSVSPGVPHWKQTDHNQVDTGQGYDYHDPVSLQIGGESGYKTGTAISMYGKVGFRTDQSVINTDHGRIIYLEITRKYGTQGTFDFLISYNSIKSTGLLGDIRSDTEHGFDICKVDVDLLTLNPQVSAEGRKFRIRMLEGHSRMTLKVIAPYRTTVRTMDPVILEKPYTYLVNERTDMWAGFNEATLNPDKRFAMMKQGQGGQLAQSTRFSWESLQPRNYSGSFHDWPSVVSETWTTGSYSETLQIAETDVSHLENARNWAWYGTYPHTNHPGTKLGHLKPEVKQYHTKYQVLTLPVPIGFIDPPVGIPSYEQWRGIFNIFEHAEVKYTIGITSDVMVYTRMYVAPPTNIEPYPAWGNIAAGIFYTMHPGSPGSRGGGVETITNSHYRGYGYPLTGPSAWGIPIDPADVTDYTDVDAKYEMLTYRTGKPVATHPQWCTTGMLAQVFLAGSDNSWETLYDFVYNPTNSNGQTGFESVKITPFDSSPTDFWTRDYTGAINEAQGDLMLLETEPEHTPIAGGFNAMFNYIGTDIKSIKDERVTYSSSVSSVDLSFAACNHHRYTASNRMNWPHEFERDILNYATPVYKNWTNPTWLDHDLTKAAVPGMGEGNTSSVLYDLQGLVHPLTSYESNRDKLKGYYKSCIDHQDKEVVLSIEKANENDPVQLDETTISTTYINKTTTYDVSLHGEYDDTVNIQHAMPPGGNIFEAYQAWDATPKASSVIDQLFVSDGADSNNQVLFLSLSAGALTGGTKPKNKIPKPIPKVGPKLSVSPNVVDSIKSPSLPGQPAVYNQVFKNVGEGELTLTFNNKHTGAIWYRGIISQTDTAYDSTSIPPSGDKIDDFEWVFSPGKRPDGTGASNTVALSAEEQVTVSYTLSASTLNPDGYRVKHSYQINYGPLYGGIVDKDILFDINVF